MSLRVMTRVPYGNAEAVSIVRDGSIPEVVFAAAPHGGPEALWFCFRLVETEPDAATPDKVQLTLKFFENLLGANNPNVCHPVYKPQGQGWFHMKSGTQEPTPDGRTNVSWVIPYPEPETDVAFCYPYGTPEVETLVQRSKGYWKTDTIGLSQGGRLLTRLSSDYGTPNGRQPGLLFIARQHAGETPGSWVMDGALQQLSKAKKNPFLTWVYPLANIDAVVKGDYGKDNFPYDLNRAWGAPPMRHETLVYQRDAMRWRERCRPCLAIDFHAPGACETDGLYAFLPSAEAAPETHGEADKWANVIAQSLGADMAAENFKRVANYGSRWETPTFTQYVGSVLGVPALSIETPYALCGSTLMSQKQYREAGRRLADAILRRRR